MSCDVAKDVKMPQDLSFVRTSDAFVFKKRHLVIILCYGSPLAVTQLIDMLQPLYSVGR